MKRTNIIYWIATGLFSALMLFSSIPDILVVPQAKEFMAHLGYPEYFIPFIGFLKLLGVIAILVPGYPTIKHWAYAGLFYDLMGATYSVAATDGLKPEAIFMLLPFGLWALSYFYFQKRLNYANSSASKEAMA